MAADQLFDNHHHHDEDDGHDDLHTYVRGVSISLYVCHKNLDFHCGLLKNPYEFSESNNVVNLWSFRFMF